VWYGCAKTELEGDELLPSGFGHVLRDVAAGAFQARSLEINGVLLGSILSSVPDALILIDLNGTILLLSKAAEAMFGYEARAVVGSNVSIPSPERDRITHDLQMLWGQGVPGTVYGTRVHHWSLRFGPRLRGGRCRPLVASIRVVQSAAARGRPVPSRASMASAKQHGSAGHNEGQAET
jgi:PAS domain S-box-containing protein